MLKELLKGDIVRQLIRFSLVGIESTILTYLIYIFLFNFIDFTYASSYIPGVIIGTLFGFFFNKSFSFESKEEIKRSLPIYLIIYCFSLTIGWFLLDYLVKRESINPIIALIPVLIFTTIINFFGTKILAFKNKRW
jgi:putative flippase GtrA